MITFTRRETLELLKAWSLLSLAFAIALSGEFTLKTVFVFGIALVTAGLGFLLHELGHKVVAQRFGCSAEFRADNAMLVIAVIMSFFGFVFAAPGAVWIHGNITTRKNGIISVAGPLMNLILALAFLPGMLLSAGLFGAVCSYGFMINAWLGLFNLIPFGNFDGSKILLWNKFAYFGLVVALLAATLYGYLG